jgi:two-component system KDP operon response regulator KdpE
MSDRILIIEDEPTMRILLMDYFESVGYQVLGAPDGRTALAIASSEPFGLAFVDINLPDIMGDEVMRRMRERGVAAELVVLSGNLRESYEDRIADLGVHEILEKPVDLRVLGSLAKKLLGNGRAH